MPENEDEELELTQAERDSIRALGASKPGWHRKIVFSEEEEAEEARLDREAGAEAAAGMARAFELLKPYWSPRSMQMGDVIVAYDRANGAGSFKRAINRA